MDSNAIRKELDVIIAETTDYDDSVLPDGLIENVNRWKWGSYGWVSPVSLMVTATWRKYYYPEVDCCKIWASDENGQSIQGGYSIRTEDESITIPLFAKHDLCAGFCSPNSGMQGSRAIEKMRSLKRLDKDFDSVQRTVFDLKLFAAIMNDINGLQQNELLELFKYFVCTAKAIKERRDLANKLLNKNVEISFEVLDFLADIHDPELTKCVVAACMSILFNNHDVQVTGVDDYKTASDERSGKPGDLTITKNDRPVIAVEVKDKTQTIDWNNIEKAKRIINNHAELGGFVFVLESRAAATNSVVNEMVQSSQLQTADGKRISIMSLFSLYQLVAPIETETAIINATSRFISMTPAIKPETREKWLNQIAK